MAQEILRPNAAGDATNWPGLAGPATHWEAVSDDSDASYVRNNTSSDTEDDYNLTDSGLTTETIDAIDVRFRARSETVNTGHIQVGLRLSSTNSLAADETNIPTTATDFSKLNIARPGGGSWTADDLDGLQVVAIGSHPTAAVRLFEMYVDVNYTAVGGAQRTLTLLGAGL